MTADPHALPAEHLFNLRDLGGRTTPDGATVRRGVVYRSGELADPGAATDPALVALHLRTVVDLRTASEVDERPDRLPDGVVYRHVDVLAAMPAQAAAGQAKLMSDPHAFSQAFGGFDPVAQMVATYRQLVLADDARVGYASLLRAVADVGDTPLLVHCTAGKDRTGWAATVLLSAVGVAPDQVLAEYLAVNDAVAAAFAPVLELFTASGAPAEQLRPMIEVRAEYLDAAFACVREHFGDLDGYLHEGLGLTDAELDTLRERLLV